jgi:putative ABC transport system permease protein
MLAGIKSLRQNGDYRRLINNKLQKTAQLCAIPSMFASQLKLAARNLTRNRTRTIISLSAIAFGVVALLLSGGFVEWIFGAMREAAIQTGLGHIQITRPGFREAGFADPTAYAMSDGRTELDVVRNAPGVTAVGERLILSGLVSSGDTTVAFAGQAVDPDAERILSKILVVDGDNLDANDRSGVLLGRGLAEALGLKRGEKVTFLVSVPGGGINGVEGHLLGTFSTHVKANDDIAVRMPLALARDLLRAKGAHAWVIGLSATEQTDTTLAYLRARLPADRFELRSWFDLSDFYRKSVVLLSRQLDVVNLLVGVIIVLGISNTLTMNVLERTGEIGTILALGTSRKGVLRLFVLEGFLLGVFGAVAGLIIGFVLAQLISFFGIPMPPPPGRDFGYSAEITLTARLAWWGVAIAVLPATLASLYPAWKAARLQVVDALSHNR